MKHIFIVNPAAGKSDRTAEYREMIDAAFAPRGLSYELLVSGAPGECRTLARQAAQSGEEVRLYACGGDGTLNEVINGVVGYDNAAVTHFPGGSGNDFIKIFSDPAAFRSLPRLLDAEEATFDLIRCNGQNYAVNICSMGFDARIGTEIGRYKRLPLVSGTGAYLLSTGVNFIRGIHEHYVVDVDGQHFDGNQTLMCIANGRYYGGSFNPVPDAEPDDGLLDVLLVRDVSRATVLRVIGKYKAGHYAQLPELIRHFRCRRVHIRCDRESEINLDGELMMSRDVTFEIAPQSIRFFYPRGLTYHAAAEQGGEHIAAT